VDIFKFLDDDNFIESDKDDKYTSIKYKNNKNDKDNKSDKDDESDEDDD